MKKLMVEIVNYLNEVNNQMFTESEKNEFIEEYMYLYENDEKDIIIENLKNEFENSKDFRCLQFIKELEK